MQRYGNLIIITLYLVAFSFQYYGYFSYIMPNWDYLGYEWYPDSFKLAEAVLFVLLIAMLLPAHFQRPSDLLIHILFIFPVLPMLVLYAAASVSAVYIYSTIFSFFLILLLILIPFKTDSIMMLSFNVQDLIRLFALSLIIYITLIIASGGLKYLNFNIWKVYEFRSAASDALPSICVYLSPLFGKVIVPFLLLLSLAFRNRGVALFAIACGVLLFAFTGNKGPLFYPFITLIVYSLYKRKKLGAYILVGGFCFLLVLSISTSVTGTVGSTMGTLFLRRTCFAPAKINIAYYDYFSDKKPILWAESKLTMGLVDYPYDVPTTKLIGRHYYRDGMSANTGWPGTGYMQAGIPGLLFYAFIIGLILKTFDMFAQNKDASFVTGVAAVPILVIATSSDIPTAMFTHGLLFLFVFLSCFRLKNTF